MGMFISLYFVRAVFYLLGVGVLKQMEIKCGRFQYSLDITLCFCFVTFTHVFVLFTYFSNTHAPTLVSGILVEAGL